MIDSGFQPPRTNDDWLGQNASKSARRDAYENHPFNLSKKVG